MSPDYFIPCADKHVHIDIKSETGFLLGCPNSLHFYRWTLQTSKSLNVFAKLFDY